jgi:hypothetical protein
MHREAEPVDWPQSFETQLLVGLGSVDLRGVMPAASSGRGRSSLKKGEEEEKEGKTLQENDYLKEEEGEEEGTVSRQGL